MITPFKDEILPWFQYAVVDDEGNWLRVEDCEMACIIWCEDNDLKELINSD